MRSSYSFSTTGAASLRRLLAFPAILACAIPLSAAPSPGAVAELPPVGALSRTLPAGLTGVSFPLIGEELLAGKISGNDASSIVLDIPGSALAAALAPASAGPLYVEILDGPLEGERFDIASVHTDGTAAQVVLDLLETSHSTQNALAADALASARYAIRAHVTLARLAAMFDPPLAGSNTPSLADGIQTYENEVFTRYYLRDDGEVWRKSGLPDDQRHKIIPPDASILIELRSGEKTLHRAGLVRTNAFRKKLRAGSQSFASGYPVPVSPADIGAFSDSSLPETARWFGSNRPTQADSIMIYDPGADYLDTYYLRGNGAAWYRAGGAPEDLSESAFISEDLVLIQRAHADPGFVIPVPFNP